MQLSQHRIVVAGQVIGAGLLLGPFLADSLLGERWPLPALSFMSIALILCCAVPRNHQVQNTQWLTLLALLLIPLGFIFSVDKFLLVAGTFLLASALLAKVPLSRYQTIAVVVCACLMVPLPAGTETEIATWLASVEASLFVTIGQALGFPVRLSGTQIFFDYSVVTINQDCSGTLLLIPALLGSIAAAALSKNTANALFALAVVVPGALLINLFRLGAVLGLVAAGDHELADEWHDMLGLITLALSWVLPLWFFSNLEDIRFQSKTASSLLQVTPLLIVAGLVATMTPTPERHRAPSTLQLPAYLSGWIAQDIDIPMEEASILNADKAERRLYTSASGELLLTAIYHHAPQKGREHSSERCFRAMGWHVKKNGRKYLSDAVVMTFLTVSSAGYSQSVVELVSNETRTRAGLIRLQLVTKPNFTTRQQQELMSLFADSILGEST